MQLRKVAQMEKGKHICEGNEPEARCGETGRVIEGAISIIERGENKLHMRLVCERDN